MFQRYDITSEDDLREALVKTRRYQQAQQGAAAARVVPLTRPRETTR